MKRVLIDANLLVLLVVGLTQPNYIVRHKRLSAYSIRDFDLLTGKLTEFEAITITPNVVSEASNFLRQFAGPGRTQLAVTLHQVISTAKETYVTSKSAADHSSYLRLGLADAASLTA